jgi:hypothetical protein
MGAMHSTLAHTDMMSSVKHLSDLQTHSRLPEWHSRHTVNERPSPPYRVVTASSGIPGNFSVTLHTHDRPLCNSTSCPCLCRQYQTQRLCRCTQCILTGPENTCMRFPSLACITQVVSKLLLSPGCRLMLVAPYWISKTWFLDLGQRLIYPPEPLPMVLYLLKKPRAYLFHKNPKVLN